MSPVTIRAATDGDRDAVVAMWEERWGGETMVVRGQVFRASELPAFLAYADDCLVGAVTYVPGADTFEVMSLDSFASGAGVGSALLGKVEDTARSAGSRRVTLVTTNDNLAALRFYQRRGYRIVGVDPGAVDRSRSLKPTIPTVGNHGIPLRDELTLARVLDEATAVTDGEER